MKKKNAFIKIFSSYIKLYISRKQKILIEYSGFFNSKNITYSMAKKAETVIKFDKVDFEYKDIEKVIFDEIDFSVRKGMKFTLMGQNGAGKSTLFKMITGEMKPQSGKIHIDKNASIAISKQVMEPRYKEMTVREFFEDQFDEKIFNIDVKIKDALDAVDFPLPTYDKTVNSNYQEQIKINETKRTTKPNYETVSTWKTFAT